MRLSWVFANQSFDLKGEGNGPIDAFINALNEHIHQEDGVVELFEYREMALSLHKEAQALAVIGLKCHYGKSFYGIGMTTSVIASSLQAVISAYNRSIAFAKFQQS